MSKKTKTHYDAAFKAQCVEETGKTYNGNISQAAQGLGLPMQTLHNWVKQTQADKLASKEKRLSADDVLNSSRQKSTCRSLHKVT